MEPSSVLGTLFRYEIKMLLRDRRTMFIAVVAPLILFPLVIFALRFVERSDRRRIDETTYLYAVTGNQEAWARSLVQGAIDGEGSGRVPSAPSTFEERPTVDPEGFLSQGRIHLVVEGLSPEEYGRLIRDDSVGSGGAGLDGEELRVPVLRLRYRAQSEFSRAAMSELRERLVDLRSASRDSLFQARGFPVPTESVARVESVNTASAQRVGGALLGQALLPFLLFLMLTGGSIVAADAITGEKERGTLETLLTTAAPRAAIVSAKQLAIIVVGVAIAVINILNLLVYVVVGVIDLPAGFAVSLSALDLLLLLVLFVPIAVLVSNALLVLSGYAKSYKEYQIYFLPLFLVFLAPSLVAVLPGMDLRSAIAFVPIAGIGVAVKEVMVGEYDVLFLFIAFLSTSGAAYGLSRLTERSLSIERLISAADLDKADLVGGPALFPRHVLRWFLGLWVVFFIVSLWFGETLGLRGQILINLVGIFFGGSLLMIRRYRLPVREAFAIRPVHPAVWLAVLVGTPSAYILGIGLSQLVDTYLFPVPQAVLEAFGEVMLAEEIPLWQLVLFVSIMPGIFEELTFRGVLLHGLRHLRPWVICLIIGAIFGLFHVSLFRILPTAYLGAILAAVVLMTGSVLPAVLWHALNNAIALVPSRLGWIDTETEFTLPHYSLAVVGITLAFFILWRVRRPYPRSRNGRPSSTG